MTRKMLFLGFIALWAGGCACGGPGVDADDDDDDVNRECSDTDGDGFGAGAGCDGSDCDDTNPEVWDESQCEALCAEDPHATGCECTRAEFPEPEICYAGPAETLGIGGCRAGLRTCTAEGEWSPCDGQVLPGTEVCDEVDNNCDGVVDEGVRNECGTCNAACEQDCVGSGEGCVPFDVDNEGNNVEDCEGDPDCVTLGGRTISLHVIWIVNTSQGSISHIDTDTREEVGRYRTSPWDAAGSPSRTSVDYLGDVVVGNRHFGGVGSVTRIAAEDCPAGDTSEGSELLAWEDDACVLWHSEVGNNGGIARAVAVQDVVGLDGVIDERVWVGLYSERRYVELDRSDGSETGREANVSPCNPYGAALDRDGWLWSACLSSNFAGFNTEDEEEVITRVQPGSNYGITVDEDGIVWTGGTCTKYDPAEDEFTTIAGCSGSGIAADGEGWIWVGGASCGGAWGGTCRIDKETLEVTNVAAQSRGFGVTFNGEIWAVPMTSYVEVITPNEPGEEEVERLEFGLVWPYSYTDMTGFQLRNATDPEGYYGHVFEGCPPSADPVTNWTAVTWEAVTPVGTFVSLSIRNADTLEALSAAAWIPIGNTNDLESPASLEEFLGEGPHGRYLEVRATLISADRASRPQLHALGTQYYCEDILR